MNVLVYMIPGALALGGLGLAAFLWALKSGQFEDPDGAAARILIGDDRPMLDGTGSIISSNINTVSES